MITCMNGLGTCYHIMVTRAKLYRISLPAIACLFSSIQRTLLTITTTHSGYQFNAMLFNPDLLGVWSETGRLRMSVLSCLALLFVSVAWSVTYNVVFHPLSKFPGPVWGKFTRLPFYVHGIMGTQAKLMLALHEKHGSVVRMCPDELSYTDPRAWRDIYGHQKGKGQNPKAADIQ